MEKQCAKCSHTFNCQNETRGCWCEGLQLDKATLSHLRVTYDNCLCPVCLKAFATASEECPAAEQSFSLSEEKKHIVEIK